MAKQKEPKKLVITQSEKGYLNVGLAKNVRGMGKKPVLSGGEMAKGSKTLVDLNRQALSPKVFALLVEGLLDGSLKRSSTKPEIYAFLTSPGGLKAEDYTSKAGKPLAHIYKYVDNSAMLRGTAMKRHGAFPSMVMAFVAEDDFKKMWKAALDFAPRVKKAGIAQDRATFESEYSQLAISII